MLPLSSELLIPPLEIGLPAATVGLVWAAVLATAVGTVRRRGVRVAYTRKLFHFGIFTGAAAVHTAWGLGATNAYGAAVAALVLGAVWRGRDSPLFDLLARERDRPREALFIVVPLATTALGGLLSALWTGPYASVAYLVAGWGDAAGEPAGARWGRHPYRVPSLAGVPAERTVEGSVAVFFASWAAAAVALWRLAPAGAAVVWHAAAVALVATAVEAVSNHGLDNLTVQLAASGTAWALLG